MRELDVVELKTDSGRWPAGTAATVLKLIGDSALIEISNDRGHSEDFLTLPQDAVRITWSRRPSKLGA